VNSFAQDPQTGFLSTTAGDLATDSLLEPGQPEASGAGEVAAVTAQKHAHRRNPGARAKRPLGGVQSRGPDTLDQVAHLLDL
jgi:hypothetical protein